MASTPDLSLQSKLCNPASLSGLVDAVFWPAFYDLVSAVGFSETLTNLVMIAFFRRYTPD